MFEIFEEPLYQPLAAGQIRLLTIFSIDETIDCTLETSTLSDVSNVGISYNALSYVWGSQPFSETIFCNGKPLNVTPSLAETLRELFRYGEAHYPALPFWIDAICLNQNDPEEITVHVPLMCDIYSRAATTLVYLGPAEDDSDLAMTSAADLRERLGILGDHKRRDESLHRLGIDDQEHLFWQAILLAVGNLLSRPWFSRVWTFQEAVLSTHIILGCGSEWIDWDVLFGLSETIRNKFLVEYTLSDDEWVGKDAGVHKIISLGRLRTSYDPASGVYIPELLSIGRIRKCKEPVDHLWGILGVMHPKTRENIRRLGWIDYTSTGKAEFCRTYITFAKWLVQLDPRLYLLSTARSEYELQGLPSWCPNWASEPLRRSLEDWEMYCSGFTPSEPRCCRITAEADSDRIRVLGFRVDIIDDVIDSVLNTPEYELLDTRVKKGTALFQWEISCLQLSQRTFNSTGVPEAHMRTLIGDPQLHGVSFHLSQNDPLNGYNLWKECIQTWKKGGTAGEMASDLLPHLPMSSEEYESSSNYFSAVNRLFEDRAFFSTTGGRIGVGPSDVARGDVVCVFYSGGPVYIIRFKESTEEGSEAEMIGDAYVHGLMKEGEALNSLDRGPDEEFILV